MSWDEDLPLATPSDDPWGTEDSDWGSSEADWGNEIEAGWGAAPATPQPAAQAAPDLISRSKPGLPTRQPTSPRPVPPVPGAVPQPLSPTSRQAAATAHQLHSPGPAALAALSQELDARQSPAPEQVMLLQEALKAIGHPLEPSGQFERKTLNALQTFQMHNKLPITGRLDARSRHVLARRWEQEQQKNGPKPIASEATPPKLQPRSSSPITHPHELPGFVNLHIQTLEQDLFPASAEVPASQGPEVELLQQILIQAGFELGLSGVFDKATYLAVRKFQLKTHIPMTGKVEVKTREALNALIDKALKLETAARQIWYVVYPLRKLSQLPIEDEWEVIIQDWIQKLLLKVNQQPDLKLPLPAVALRDQPLLSSLLGTPGQQGIVSRGIEVERLQETLLSLGYALKANQQFDLQTFDALKQYQLEQQLPVTGLADEATRERLNVHLRARYEKEKAWDKALASIRAWQHENNLLTSAELEAEIQACLHWLLEGSFLPLRQDLGPSHRAGMQSFGPDVLLLKCFLKQVGHELTDDMHFDKATTEALKTWQQANQLPASGYLDSKTRQQIQTLWQELGGVQASCLEDEDLIY